MTSIIKPGHNCSVLAAIDSCGLLVDGVNYYRAFFHAARQAERFILITGWQFDSEVKLLPGCDGERFGDTRFLPFLNRLCQEKPNLHIYILAWDFSMVFTLEREWMQDLLFNWSTNPRLIFRFDDRHPLGASHHQKMVIIDDRLAFVGGMDLCSNRWDNRCHKLIEPDRKSAHGDPYPPYHDLQAFITGPAIKEVTSIFLSRWKFSGGGTLTLNPPSFPKEIKIGPYMPIHALRTALSQTRGKIMIPLSGPVTEIRYLYPEAILAAERMIYIENQYFTSQAVHDALIARMEHPTRPKLDIVILLPKRFEGFFEDISMGNIQAKILQSLRMAANRTGHRLGVYYMGTMDQHGNEVGTYIHSKVLVIDDRFLSVGSANTSNRSLGTDSELNLSWEVTDDEDPRLEESIRRIRVSLLAELTGRRDLRTRKELREPVGLVGVLDRLAEDPDSRLRHHQLETLYKESDLVKTLTPEDMVIDPMDALLEEKVHQKARVDPNNFFIRGITWLSDQFLNRNLEETLYPKEEKASSLRKIRPMMVEKGFHLAQGLALFLLIGLLIYWIFF